MDNLGNTLNNNAEVVLFFSFIIVTVATVICIFTLRLMSPERYLYRMSSELDTMQKKFLESSRYHLDVVATLDYLDQIRQRPELLARLGQISREILAASLLQRMSLLAGTLAVMHTEMEEAEMLYAASNGSYTEIRIGDIRKEIARLQADQQALHQLCEHLDVVPSENT